MEESRFQEEGFNDFLKEVVELGGIEGAALGITKQVMDKGYPSLTDNQIYVFKKEVLDHYVTDSCTMCASPIPWEEMVHASDNGGYCSWCSNQIEKAKEK